MKCNTRTACAPTKLTRALCSMCVLLAWRINTEPQSCELTSNGVRVCARVAVAAFSDEMRPGDTIVLVQGLQELQDECRVCISFRTDSNRQGAPTRRGGALRFLLDCVGEERESHRGPVPKRQQHSTNPSRSFQKLEGAEQPRPFGNVPDVVLEIVLDSEREG